MARLENSLSGVPSNTCVCVCGGVGGVFSIVHEKAVDLFGEGG